MSDYLRNLGNADPSTRCIQCGGELEPCRCRPDCPGGWCVACLGPQKMPATTSHPLDEPLVTALALSLPPWPCKTCGQPMGGTWGTVEGKWTEIEPGCQPGSCVRKAGT